MEEKDPNKLDKSKTFGTVFGDPHIGFEQGGRDFDHSGRLYLRPDGTTPEKKEDLPRETLKLRTDRLKQAWQQKTQTETE